MTRLSVISLILVIHQFSNPVESAYVNMSLSSTNVVINGSLDITLLEVNPIIGSNDFERVDIHYVRPGGTPAVIADIPRRIPKFQLKTTTMPPEYKGRLNVSSALTVTLSPVTFADEKTNYYLSLFYFDTSTSSYKTVESKHIELENVYAFPDTNSNPLQARTTAIEGSPKVITCTIKSRPQSNITWSHDVEVVGIKSQNVRVDGGYYITNGILNITQPSSLMDGKKISCTGTPMFGSPIIQNSTLTVQYRPKDTALSVTPAILSLNNNVQFTCSAIGKPNVTNYKFFINGKLVGNTTDGKLTLNASNCANYTGTYTCVPESSIGEGEKKTMVKEFNGTVTLTSMLASKSIDEGHNETLTCSATGCPAPHITWTKNGKNLTQTGNTLTLLSVNKNDTGKYACHASNGKDSKSAEMKLTVNYKPDMVTFTTPTLKPVNGNHVVFTCNSNGLPAPSYRILRINGSNETVVQNNSSGTYTIPSINYADYIDYKVAFKCVPHNRLGDGPSKNHSLDIQVPPMTNLVMSPMTIREFGNATLRCVISAANPPASISLKDPSNGNIAHTSGVAALTNVTRHGHGIYSCIANNSVGSPVTKTIVLMVQYKPDSTTFSSSPSSKPIHGQSLTLTCSSNGRPLPSYRIQSITGSNNATLLSNTTSGNYTISKISYTDYVDYNVTFRCVPHNFIGSGPSKDINLEVQVQPMLVISSNQTVKDGDTVNLYCNITTANPPAIITWRNQSNSIIGHTNGAVTINSIKREQAGSYSCLADNGVLGAVMKTTHVVVQHAPVESKLSASHKDVNENGTVTLTCTAVAVPAATYQFYQMNNGNKDILHSSSASGVIEVTVLRNAKTNGYNNTYGCKAMNALGNGTEQPIVVNVLVKPTGISLSPNVAVHRVNESSKVDIKCSVSASNPSAQFKWTKSGSVAFSKTSDMLSFATVNRTDAGKYTCNASNALGHVIKEVDLVVQYGPEITNGYGITDQKCLTGSVNITCEAIGNPHPFVQIIFAGNSKKNGTGSAVYTINSIQVADLGNYICIAKNALKEVNATRVLQKIAHPGAVTDVKLVKATPESIEISWTLPVHSCPGSIKEIKVEYKEVPAGATKSMPLSGSASNAKIVGLAAGKEYDITVIIVDRTNAMVRSSTSKQKTSAKPTSAPKTGNNAALIGGIAGGIMFLIILVILFCVIKNNRHRPSQVMPTEPLLFTIEAIGSDKILVKWSTSQPATSNPINHYNIYWKTLKGQENVKSVKGSADTYKEPIDGLRPATQYEFRIVAVESDGTIGRCSLSKVQSTDHESGETGHIGAYGTTGTVEKKSNDVPMTKINNGNSYFGPDGKSIYASVSMKDKNNTSAPGGGVDNPKFVADSDGAYEPVVSITPKQSPAPKKKPEGNYAELSSFQVSGNAVTPESKPVKTEYATLEEVGPIFNKDAETKPDGEDSETHKIVVSPEKEEGTADSDVTASKVDII